MAIPAFSTDENQDGLITGLTRLLREFKDLRILFKFKRATGGFIREAQGIVQLLQHPQVIAVPWNADPYLAIGMADACIGSPFTSPPMVGKLLGKPVCYYDPSAAARITYQGFFQEDRIETETDLLHWVSKWIAASTDHTGFAARGTELMELMKEGVNLGRRSPLQ